MRPDLNILIVDDEKRACTNLKNILTEYVDPDLNIVGLAYNTYEAEKQISRLTPDAVFLDINMPNENAFHFLERIAPFNFEVVFVTSYDEYAVKAFKLNAVDYILKPLSITDLKNAVEKLKNKITYKKVISHNLDPYSSFINQFSDKLVPHKIVLKTSQTTDVVDFRDIYFVEAMGSYSKVFFLKNNLLQKLIMSNPLTEYEELLPPTTFYRIHKSYLVNCSVIKNITKDDITKVVLKNNMELPVSRRRLIMLLEFLKNNRYIHD